jgi:hypothetical protein
LDKFVAFQESQGTRIDLAKTFKLAYHGGI